MGDGGGDFLVELLEEELLESLKVVVVKELDQDFLEQVQLLKVVVVKDQDQDFLEPVLELLVVEVVDLRSLGFQDFLSVVF